MTLSTSRTQAAAARPPPRIDGDCAPQPKAAVRAVVPMLAPDVSAFSERAGRRGVELNPTLASDNVQLGAKQVRAMLIAGGCVWGR